MKALIFAAGKGERMLPLTESTPKPLLKIRDKMLIEYHLESLVKAGIKEVVINVAWKAEKIIEALGDGSRWGLVIHYSKESKPLETGGGIVHAKSLLGTDPIILLNADVFSDFDLRYLLSHKLENTWAHLIFVPNPEHNPDGDYSLIDGFVRPWSEAGTGYTFSGISLMNPNMVYDFPHAREVFPLREVFAWAIDQNKLCASLHTGEWSDVGTPERLQELNTNSE